MPQGAQRTNLGQDAPTTPLTYRRYGIGASTRITWDDAKNHANQQKHGLSFEDAQQLFLGGSDYLELFDDEHSHEEDRFIAVGYIIQGLVVVVWTERDDQDIRIISARLATKAESALFHKYMTGQR